MAQEGHAFFGREVPVDVHSRRIWPGRHRFVAVLAGVAALVLVSSCTADAPPVAKPLPSGQAGATGDICAQLLPLRAIAGLEAAGIRADGAPKAVTVPLNAPGANSTTSTTGCEMRIEGAPLSAVLVRRVFDTNAIEQLQRALKSTTDEVAGAPANAELRWSDAASTVFAFPFGGRTDAYVVQLVLQRPDVDRKRLAVELTQNVLKSVASPR